MQSALLRLLHSLNKLKPASVRDFFNLAAVHVARAGGPRPLPRQPSRRPWPMAAGSPEDNAELLAEVPAAPTTRRTPRCGPLSRGRGEVAGGGTRGGQPGVLPRLGAGKLPSCSASRTGQYGGSGRRRASNSTRPSAAAFPS
jgi:hypothetical protein